MLKVILNKVNSQAPILNYLLSDRSRFVIDTHDKIQIMKCSLIRIIKKNILFVRPKEIEVLLSILTITLHLAY